MAKKFHPFDLMVIESEKAKEYAYIFSKIASKINLHIINDLIASYGPLISRNINKRRLERDKT